MRKFCFFLVFLMLTFTLAAQITLVPYAASWKYLDNGSDQGTAWRSLSFDDASWKSGNGKFGYGISDAATVISYGPNASNKYATTYFRKVVNISNPLSYTSFTCNVKRDDGVVVYVNGKEVYRNKVPTGTITYSTLANSGGDKGVVPKTFTISNTAFTSGNNIIAVEIHIEKPTSSLEMAFDLELLGTASSTPADQTPPIVQSINRQSPTTETTSATAVTYRVVFSEKVVGVHAGDFAATAVSGTVSGMPSSVAAVGTDGSTYDVTVNSVSGAGILRLDLNSSGTGITDNAGNAINGGYTSGQTYTIEPVTSTAPTVISINRQLPNTATTNATSVIYRALFSQGVIGVDAGDFTATATSGTVAGIPSSVAPVGSDGTTYDITVSSITGTGNLRLDLKSAGTGITNVAGNPISGGFTSGQTYTIAEVVSSALVSYGATWKFLDDGSNQGTAWQSLSYDEASWKTGNGKFGYGISDASTVISYGPNANSKYVTTYFRKTINIANPYAATVYNAGVKRDDGVIIYVNGKEVFRNKMPSGTPTFTTLASSGGDKGLTPKTFTISPSAFVSGINVIAVEVHLQAANAPSMAFDLEIKGDQPSTDQTPPTVTSINRQSPSIVSTNASSVVFRAVFSESVQNVDAGDFSVSGSGVSGIPFSVAAVGADGTMYDVTVNSVAGNGSLQLDLKSSGTGITDAAGNAISGGFTSGQAYLIDQISPNVVSISRQSPTAETTTATTVVYRAVFSEKVKGIDKEDFTLTAVDGSVSGTLASDAVAVVSGDSATYDITVSTIAGSGTLRLDLNGSGTGIQDVAGNTITGGFTSAENYIITESIPSLTSVGIASNNTNPSLAKTGDVVTLSFTASEPINAPAVTIGTHSVTAVAGGDNSFTATYTLTAEDVEGLVPFNISFTSAQGKEGVTANTTTNNSAVTFDRTLPLVTSIVRHSPAEENTTASTVTFRVAFSEKVTGVDPSDFALHVISGAVSSMVETVTALDNNTYDVTVSSLSGAGVIRLDLNSSGTDIADAASNGIAIGFTNGESYTIMQSAPLLTSVGITSNNNNNTLAKAGDMVTLSFTASEPINMPTVTIATHGVDVVATGDNNFTAAYTLIADDAEGVVPFSINFSNTAGTAGTPVSTTTNGSSVTFDKTAPDLTSISRQAPSVETTSETTVTFRATFPEKVSGVDLEDFAITTVNGSATGTVSGVAPVGTDGNVFDVTVSSITGNGTLRLDLKNSETNIVDGAGNAVTTGFTAGESYHIEEADMTAPILVSIDRQTPETEYTSNNSVVFRVTFSEKVTGVDAVDFTATAVSGNVSGTISGVDAVGVAGSIFDVTISSIIGSGTLRLDLNTEQTGITDAAGNLINSGFSSGQTFIIEEKDVVPPTVLSITRQLPLEATFNGSAVTYRVTFSEAVNGVDAADFAVTVLAGSLTGNVETVTAQSISTFDVTVSSISGSGEIRLDLNASNTGIIDVAGNAISGGFTGGESYMINQSVPTLTLVNITSNNSNPLFAKAGDIITLRFTASESINEPNVTIATHLVGVVTEGENSFSATYTITAADNAGPVAFTIDFISTAGNTGEQVTNTTDGSSVILDNTAPIITGINRQSPASENTTATTVTLRATFSEAVSGVDKGDFTLTVLSGTVNGTLADNAVSPVGTDGTTYDVTISSITGNGSLRLDVNSASTDIKDMAGNNIGSDFTSGQGYQVQEQTLSYGFASVTSLSPLNISDYTKDKPQAKAWKYAGKWWCVLPTNAGVKIFRLDGTSWTDILNIRATTNARADCRVVGDLVHILLFKGASQNSSLTTVQYDPATGKYKMWPQRTSNVNIVFPAGSETATLVVDSKGRIWAASDGVTDMTVRWSDAPYTTWSEPIVIASGAKDDDICTLVEIPSQGKIGLFWSNQVTQRFGFRTHTDGADPMDWSTDEVPASQSAINYKYGMADDHMNIKVASDGTMYCGVKTGYNTVGYPQLSLLIRRPSGTWDDLYPVTLGEGTQPLLVLNEAKGKVKVVYTTNENGGEIVYKESSTANISFGEQVTLISGGGYLYNYSTSTHQTYDPEVVILATQQSTSPMQVTSVLASDEALFAGNSVQAVVQQRAPVEMKANLAAYPNPFSGQATVSFSLEQAGEYSLSLYDMKGSRLAVLRRGVAEAGQLNTVRVDGSALSSGFYLVRLETPTGTQTLKMILKK